MAGTGGVVGMGGVVGTGGVVGMGGAVGSGGSTLMGGTTGMAAGGAVGSGGAVAGSGGARTGGMVGSGGAGAGGVVGSGGAGVGGTGAGGRGGTVSGGAGGSAAGGTGGTTRDAGATGGTGGLDAGQTSTYSGCLFGGGINRAVVAKLDPQAGICVALVLSQPAFGPDAGFGLTITQGWGVEFASRWPSTTADCVQRFPPAGAESATSASGSVSVNTSSATIGVDAVLYFPASDTGPAQSIELKAQNVDINHAC